ncbi:MAG: TIGR03905 family TSCPD domain-containing protein [Marinifilaceae bacterium]
MEVRIIMEKIHYTPIGVCSKSMEITVTNGIVEDVVIVGGCSGNLQGISQLVKGMKVEDVIQRLRNIQCGAKTSSCPDQLAHALLQHINN